jgi:hypothetical protein
VVLGEGCLGPVLRALRGLRLRPGYRLVRGLRRWGENMPSQCAFSPLPWQAGKPGLRLGFNADAEQTFPGDFRHEGGGEIRKNSGMVAG